MPLECWKGFNIFLKMLFTLKDEEKCDQMAKLFVQYLAIYSNEN